jgi:hypothetical protein
MSRHDMTSSISVLGFRRSATTALRRLEVSTARLCEVSQELCVSACNRP